MHTMQITNSATSQLVIVDMQVKLAVAMPTISMQQVTKNCGILAQAALIFNVPTLLTEQYPAGLGETLPEIKQFLGNISPIAKTAFSACDEPKFNQRLSRDRSQLILTGMEAHVCVLQTALALLQLGKQVFMVEDAIISRNEVNRNNALARMREAGCVITNTESVIFEWLGNAKHEHAKTLFKLIK